MMSPLRVLCTNLILQIVSFLKLLITHSTCFILSALWLFFPVWIQYFTIKLLFSQYYFIIILYGLWMIYDRRTLVTGGRLMQFSRDFFLWKFVHKYYPITVHKLADLDQNKNYIFGLHPHGVICYGTGMSFLLHDKKYRELFPGITVRLCVHNLLVNIPVVRELMLIIGLCSVDKESIEYIISKMGTGNAAAIVVGGGKEFFLSNPFKIELLLKNRKGFVKLALKHGVSLVPCITFGENEFLTEPMNGLQFLLEPWRRWSKINRFFEILCMVPFLITYALINTKTVIKRFTGLQQFRKHFHTIIGNPINVMKNNKPTIQEIDDLHQLYIKELTALFHEYKKLVPGGDGYELIIH